MVKGTRRPPSHCNFQNVVIGEALECWTAQAKSDHADIDASEFISASSSSAVRTAPGLR
jgi:hypothetical protein